MTTQLVLDLIPLADAHQAADEYIAGQYEWRDGACAIGCSVHDAKLLGKMPRGLPGNSHAQLAEATGIPLMLLYLADHVFEGLPLADRRAWTPRFLRACSTAPAIASAPARVMARLAERLSADAIREDVKAVTAVVAKLWRRRAAGDDPPKSEWDAAREQADAAREQAYAAWEQAYAAWEQADAAWEQADAAREQADAAWQQANAAREQAYAAREQAYAAREQANAAWQQAYAAWQQANAAWQQAYAAREQFWSWCADVVCEEISREATS